MAGPGEVLWAWIGARPPWGSFPHCPTGGTMTYSTCCQAHSGAHKQTQLTPKCQALKADPCVCLCIASSPRAVQGCLGGARQPPRVVEGVLGGPAQGAAILEPLENCPEEPEAFTPQSCLGRSSAAASNMVYRDQALTIRAPQRPQQADMSSAVPREMGQHAQAAASSELHNGGKGVPRGHPFSLTEGIPISELHLPSVPAVQLGALRPE